MNTGKSAKRSKPCFRVAGMLAAVASLYAMNADATMVVGDANTTTVVTPTTTIITATKDATLTVTVPGEIEILLVGGGGGAGGSTEKTTGYTSGDSRGGGGGSGGYRYTRNPESGGHGIVIIRYKKPERGFILSVQ